MADEPLRVLICDDEPGMRLILGKLVGKAEGFEVVGEAETANRRWRCLKKRIRRWCSSMWKCP